MQSRELVSRLSIKVIHREASPMKTLVALEETIRREGVTDGSTWNITFILAMQLRDLVSRLSIKVNYRGASAMKTLVL